MKSSTKDYLVAVAAARSRGTVIAPKAAVIVADDLSPSNPGKSLLIKSINSVNYSINPLQFHKQYDKLSKVLNKCKQSVLISISLRKWCKWGVQRSS